MDAKKNEYTEEKSSSAAVDKSSVALREEATLARWKTEQIFEKTLAQTEGKKPFVFYDGPPFATGTPHYGHLLAGTIKDAIPRYQTMRGRHVRRQWGWDCHGLPVENLIEKKFSLTHKKDIEDFGIEKFNEEARKTVFEYAHIWEEQVPRMGRFVDMTKPYRTLDWQFTDSVWWAFGELNKKGLVYEGYKVMYVCPRCETVLASNEVAQGYKEVTDLSVTAKFPVAGEQNTYFLAWTTTPWTLPGNVALAVGGDIAYVRATIEGEEGVYIFAKERAEFLKKKVTIISEMQGSELVGKRYEPPFPYYANEKGVKNSEHGWSVYAASFVTTDAGTGIVHIAPAFGADDYALAQKEQLPFVQHVSMSGQFKKEVTDFPGVYVKQKDDTQSTDVLIIKYLAGKGLLFGKEKIVHSYPLCWRCETPLLNYATSSWFVRVKDARPALVAENKKITWIPEGVGEGRFGNWLADGPDWAVSRTRYWGPPLPVWRCGDCNKTEVISSVSDLRMRMHGGKKEKNRYLVMRHGESENNVTRTSSSSPSDPWKLTEKGRTQVEHALSTLKDECIDVVITSDMLRTKETADIVKKGLGISDFRVDARLREIDLGVLSGRPYDEHHIVFASYEDHFKAAPEKGETLQELKNRLMEFLDEIDKKESGKTILLVTHEWPAWMLVASVEGCTQEETIRVRGIREDFIKNAEILPLCYTPFPHNDKWELDLHRPYIDEVMLPCVCSGSMRRVPEVFDCWFESGSMPFAQFHYPAENQELFKKNFPAEFIAEGVDQTRGWFYSLIVLGQLLFGKAPYKHVVVNGLVLAEDGRKMSKSLKNYPDPMVLVDTYGADAVRFFMLSSPAVHGEDLLFSEKGVGEVYKKHVLRLENVLSFLELYKQDYKDTTYVRSSHVLDVWITKRLKTISLEITTAMDAYLLDRAVRPFELFIDDLSTWYLRRSRERIKEGGEDGARAYHTLKQVLVDLATLLAPFMPFLAEHLYVRAGGTKESVHLEAWPTQSLFEKVRGYVEKNVLKDMSTVRTLVSLALDERKKNALNVRQPLAAVMLSSGYAHLGEGYRVLIQEEVNVKEVRIQEDQIEDVRLDMNITDELKKEGNYRELVRAVQQARKEANLLPKETGLLNVTASEEGLSFIEEHWENLMIDTTTTRSKDSFKIGEGLTEVGEYKISLSIKRL